MSRVRLTVLAFLAIGLGSCGGDSSDQQFHAAVSQEFIEACHWSYGRPALADRVRARFLDRESGDVRLLISAEKVKPGTRVGFAPVNESDKTIHFGDLSHIATTDGEEVPTKGDLSLLIGLTLNPGKVGLCHSLEIPKRTEPGDYLAVLESVEGIEDEPVDLKASFEVVPQP